MEFRHWNKDTEDGYEEWHDIDDHLDIQIGFTGSEERVKVSVGDDADEYGLGIFACFGKQSPGDAILNALIGVSGEDTAKDLLLLAGQTEVEANQCIRRSGQHSQQIMFRIKHNVCRLLVPAILMYYGIADTEVDDIQKQMDSEENEYKAKQK